MRYIADLHIHSKYSRATARNLDLENVYIWAQLKGITVVATGDFTHPAWFAEIKEKLVPAEDGLFRLSEELEKVCDKQVPLSCRRPVRFALVTEISNIYKKDGAVRKNHNLVFMPGLEEVSLFNSRLDTLGNIKADGRPILGMDARNLLEIALEVSEDSLFIPAHVWTPWFSLFGSKSGFDSLRDCFEDLAPYVFALETGLSSDPPMNWRVSEIDGLTLVSNSDAHSPANLGREANLFDTELSYQAMVKAIKTGDPDRFCGTFEFFPQEGKYHHDGHRACGVTLTPAMTREMKGICPVCGKPLTLGVLYRVEELADRPDGRKPEQHHPFRSIIPLPEIISELLGVGWKSKKVQQAYRRVLERLGPEFEVLYEVPIDRIRSYGGVPFLDIAISRMREGRVNTVAGYDGEYGRITIFGEGDLDRLRGEAELFTMPSSASVSKDRAAPKALPRQLTLFDQVPEDQQEPDANGNDADPVTGGLNEQQLAAVTHPGGHLAIVAGPGSGKTRTLTCRIAYLVRTGRAEPSSVLAVTFTNRAAREMEQRLGEMLGPGGDIPTVSTFHAFCFRLLTERGGAAPVVIDEYDRQLLAGKVIRQAKDEGMELNINAAGLLDMIAAAKQAMIMPDDDPSAVALRIDQSVFSRLYAGYQNMLAACGACDYEDMICNVVKLLEQDEDYRKSVQGRFRFLLVDEFQDLNHAQYRLVRALAGPGVEVFIIGDPDQAIYGFRGASPAYFGRFMADYPDAGVIALEKNYRSASVILDASYQVISRQTDNPERVRVYSQIAGPPTVTVAGLGSEKSEAVFVGKTIEEMVGGLGFHSVDFKKAGYGEPGETRGFSDFAVLFRTKRQAWTFADILESAGIPCHVVSKESLFAAKGVAEAVSFLRLVEGCGCLVDLERVAQLLCGARISEALDILMQWGKERGLSVDGLLSSVRRFPVPGLGQADQRKIAGLACNIEKSRVSTEKMQVHEKLACLAETVAEIGAVVRANAKATETFERVINVAKAAGADSRAFFEQVALASDEDALLPGIDKVMLMTIHAAKGLEFPVVFVAGCEEGLIPFYRPDDKAPDIGEERRLFYVAMTRARQKLFLTWAGKRPVYGKTESRKVSRFIDEIEASLKENITPKNRKRPGPVQLELF